MAPLQRAAALALLALTLALPAALARQRGSPERDRESGGAGRGCGGRPAQAKGTCGDGGRSRGGGPPAPPTLRPLLPPPPAVEILVAFRDSIANWESVKEGQRLQGWDDDTPAFLWQGVVMDFDLRVREL